MGKVPSLKLPTFWEEQTKSSNLCSGCTAIVSVVPKKSKRTLLASALIVFIWNVNHFHMAVDNYLV